MTKNLQTALSNDQIIAIHDKVCSLKWPSTPWEKSDRLKFARALLATAPASEGAEDDGQFGHLDLQNHQYRIAFRKIMARLTDLLDEDQFGNIESIVREVGIMPPDQSSGGEASEREVDAFLDEVRAELIRAREKFPGDRIMTIALAEEFGELCKAVLDESAANVRKEAVQTAVMCARVVLDGDGSVNDWRREKGLDPLTDAALAAQNEEKS